MPFESATPSAPDATWRIPQAPLLLGLAGLLPFWGLAVALMVPGRLGMSPGSLAAALSSYGAVILSFLGGIRWGLATAARERQARDGHFTASVVPSLLAWAALALPAAACLSVLGLLALAIGAADKPLVALGLAPPWFGRLRAILSVAAGAALLLGALASSG